MVTEEKVREILNKPVLAQGIEKYKYIMNKVWDVDVSKNVEFQNKFRDFYQLRRFYSDEFADTYLVLWSN